VLYRCHKHARAAEQRLHVRQTETTLEAVHPSEVEPPVDYIAHARRAEMCVVPEGKAGSYGHRALLSVLLGCVPLVTKEAYSYEFFHETLNWTAAALFVPPAEMPSLLARLPTPSTLRAMRHAGEALRRRVLWTSIYGDCHLGAPMHRTGSDDDGEDAFDTLLRVLRAPRRHFRISAAHRAPRAPELLSELDG